MTPRPAALAPEGRATEAANPRLVQAGTAVHAEPEMMDALWASGWRHFGCRFFRYSISRTEQGVVNVIPLRIDLGRFRPSKSHRRIQRRNADLEVRVRPTQLDQTRRRLFEAHKSRFRTNVPTRIEEFLGQHPATVPCLNLEVGLYSGSTLVAAAFLDVGREAVSSVYALFDPAESARSLGICTILHEIDCARRLGCRFYYLGYAYVEPSPYDYKKRLPATEWYDWRGHWRPWDRPRESAIPPGENR